MPIHDTIKLVAKGIADTSDMPAMGPSNDILREKYGVITRWP